MKVLGYIILACMLLAALQAALSIVVIGFTILLLFGLFAHPGETFGFLAFVLFANLLQTHPIACVWTFSLMLITTMVIQSGGRDPASKPSAPLRDGQPRQPRLPAIGDE